MKIERKGFSTIKGELFLLSFIFLILVSLLFACIFINILYNESVTSAKNSLHQCSNQIVTYTEGIFHENAAIVDILSRNDTIINAGYGRTSDVIEIYNDILKNNTNITYIYSGYIDGSLIIEEYDTPIDFNSTIRPWYIAAASTNDVAKLVYSDASTGVWLFSQCRKLLDNEGNMIGAVSIDCSNESISGQLSTKYKYESQRSFIVNFDSTVLIHPDEKEINRTLKDRMSISIWNSVINGKSNYAEYDKDGINAMAYFERIPGTDFIVVTAINASEIIRPIIISTVYLFLLIVAISIVLGFILSRLLIHRFAYPIMELGSRIQNLAAGQLGKTHNIKPSNAEINEIAESIEIIVKDIANREEEKKAAEYLSFHDYMTGLYNRRFFEIEYKNLDIKKNYPLCIICCDINGLKLINDVFGHAAGDRLICVIASCMQKNLRSEDVLARIGGDEFAVALPNISEDDAKEIIQQIKSSFPDDSIFSAEVCCSFGYAIKMERYQELDEIMKIADEMMYDKKIMESAEMKKRIVSNIIYFARKEGLVVPISEREACMLEFFADKLCPESKELLNDSYEFRKIGLCTMIASFGYNSAINSKSHTETGYRILSAIDNYRSIAGCVLHYSEHWDGSGWPAGLSGRDIPLLSRIIAVVDGFSKSNDYKSIVRTKADWYDPSIIKILPEIMDKIKEF